MKIGKRLCMVARDHPMIDDPAIEDDLLMMEEDEECQRSLLRKQQRLRRMKSYLQFIFLYLFMVLLSTSLTNKQSIAQTGTNSFVVPFQYLDPELFPTGILHNRSPYYSYCFFLDTAAMILMPDTSYQANPYRYSEGIIDVGNNVFLDLYRDMLFSQVDNDIIINPVDYANNFEAAKTLYDVPISLMAINFHRMNEDAILSGRLWFDTLLGGYTQMPDTIWLTDTIVVADTMVWVESGNYVLGGTSAGLLSTAFEEHLLLGSSTPGEILFFPDNSFTLRYGLTSGLFISNIDSLPTVYIDFSDGMGYRLVEWDTFVDVHYQLSKTPKQQQIELKIIIPEFNIDMMLLEDISVVVDALMPDTVLLTHTLPLNCIDLSNERCGEAMISVIFSDSNNGKLVKPVLFVEGFETALKDYGDITFMNIMNDVMPVLGFPEVSELPILFDSILSNGYDIVYVDFRNARDSIQRNMLSVIKVIEWVNKELTKNGSNEKLVVAGASMGGLLTRYALRLMEIENCCHNTRLYISFDAPHSGANFPVGIQKLVKVAAETSNGWKDVAWPLSWIASFKSIEVDLKNIDIEQSWDDVLNSPAARAMLIQHIEPCAAQFHYEFYALLDSIGYPEKCRRIALINGSEKAISLTLDDPQNRIMGTGDIVNLPYAWVKLIFGLNAVTAPLYFPVTFQSYPIAYSTVYAEDQPNFFEYNNWNNSIHNMNLIIKKTLTGTLLNTIFGVSATVNLGLNPFLFALFEAALISNKSKGNDFLKTYHDHAGDIQYLSSLGLENLTCVPGGLNNSVKKLGDAGRGVVNVYSEAFSFIPSVSALDIKDMGYLPYIKYQYMLDPVRLTPFDAYWAPRRDEFAADFRENQLHVEITEENRAWILKQIESDWELRNNQGLYKGELSTLYNYAKPGLVADIGYYNKPVQTILYSVDVLEDASLFINDQREIGFAGSNIFPKLSGDFLLRTGGEKCDPVSVRVFKNGEMIIGDQLNGNTAEVVFLSNSELEIMPGGVLKVYNNSKLKIEEGASLILHPGAVIDLQDEMSVLEISGTLVIHDDASLVITGDGFVRYSADMSQSNYNKYFNLGNNAAIILHGSGKDDKMLEIATDTWFPCDLHFELIEAKAEIAPGIELHLHSTANLQNAKITSIDTNHYYNSFNIYGQKGLAVSGCEFAFGNYGLKCNLALGGNPLSLDNNLFRNNIIGLKTIDEKVRLHECNFVNNSLYGWVAENMSGRSTAISSLFENNGNAGVAFDGQLSSSLYLRDCLIKGHNYGVIISHSLLQAECSRIINNSSAGLFAGNMSQIDLSKKAFNHITDNYTGILLNKALNINIEYGYNRFSGNQYYLIGELLPNNFYDASANITKPLVLSGNHMPAPSNILPIHLYVTDPITLNTEIIGLISGSMASLYQTNCIEISGANEYLLKPFDALTGISVIQGGKYNNYTLLDAMKLAASFVSCDDHIGNDTLAISNINDILNNLPANVNDDEVEGINYSLKLMTLALNNAISSGDLDANRGLAGEVPGEYVAQIAEKVQERIEELNSSDVFYEDDEARYKMMMAQMYRVAEHYDYALDILQNTLTFNSTSLENNAHYWTCVCKAEQQFLVDSIDKRHFEMFIDSCNNMNNARLLPFVPLYGYSELKVNSEVRDIVKSIYPNPAKNNIIVLFNEPVNHIFIELFDVSGKRLWVFYDDMCGIDTALSIPDSKPGNYILKIRANGITSMHKLILK